MKKDSPAKTTALLGLLFALALAFSWLESAVTPLLGLPPGVKIGLANVVVVYALLFMKKRYALLLVIAKAGFALFRGPLAGLLSAAGGGLSLLVMVLLLLPKQRPSLFLLSVCGAVAHNAGQFLLILLYWGKASWYYAPVLLISAIAMGSLNALLLRFLLPALEKAGLKTHT